MLRRARTRTLFPYTTLFRSTAICDSEGRPSRPPLYAAPRAGKIPARKLHPESSQFFPRWLEFVHPAPEPRSEEHTSELQSLRQLVCRLLLGKKKRSRRGRRC